MAGDGARLGVAAGRPAAEPDDDRWAAEGGEPVHDVHRRVPVAVAARRCRGVDGVAARRRRAGALDVAQLPEFPGNRPGEHVHPDTITRRLRQHGIQPRAYRNTALLYLVTVTPTPVLADLLGLHANTAEKWRAAAGARWSSYPARRATPSPR